MSQIECVLENGVAIVRLDRPEVRNAQTPQMWVELANLGHELAGTARAVILTGNGPDFSAGLDRRMFTPDGIPGTPSLFDLARLPDQEVRERIATYQEAFTVWRDASFVSIAAVEGHAIGAGFQLALACDVIVAGPGASFAMKEVAWGLVPDLAGTAPMIERIGHTRALQACLRGTTLTYEEPGLVDVQCDSGKSLDAARAFAAELPDAELTREMKSLVSGYGHEDRVRQRARERDAQLRRIRSIAKALNA